MTKQPHATSGRTRPPYADKIVERKIDEIKQRSRRTRTHSASQLDGIRCSIEQFGFLNPVLIDDDGTLLAGSARLAAARMAGLEQVPTIVISHLSPAEKRAYVIADNRLAEQAGWDREELALEFRELAELDKDFVLEITGFSELEIEAFVFGDPSEDEEEAHPTPREIAVSRAGDVWRMDEHLIICGDATQPTVYDELLGGERARVSITDPPYNVPVKGHVTSLDHREFPMASGEMSQQEFIQFLTRALACIVRALVDGGLAYVAMDWRGCFALQSAAFATELRLLNHIVWDKQQGGMGSFYRSQHEFFLLFKKGQAAHRNNVELGRHGRNRTNVWSCPGYNGFRSEGRAELASHPTPKPVTLIKEAILDCTSRGEVVLDPFSGGGSTLIAAELAGRRARLIELDPLYVDVAVRRWETHSGKKAVHVQSGLSLEALAERRQGKAESSAAKVRVRSRSREVAQ